MAWARPLTPSFPMLAVGIFCVVLATGSPRRQSVCERLDNRGILVLGSGVGFKCVLTGRVGGWRLSEHA